MVGTACRKEQQRDYACTYLGWGFPPHGYHFLNVLIGAGACLVAYSKMLLPLREQRLIAALW